MSNMQVHRSAVVSRAPVQPWDAQRYLQLTGAGPANWTSDPLAATAFESMREATRAALRLPGALRAFGLPLPAALGPEIDADRRIARPDA
jgi:hypothetical protein